MAITDHGNVQAFPLAMDEAEKIGMKVIYGIEKTVLSERLRRGCCMATILEIFLQTDFDARVLCVRHRDDTGLSPQSCKITEIGAVIVKKGKVIDKFDTFTDPEVHIPARNITKLTSITDEMVAGAPRRTQTLCESS